MKHLFTVAALAGSLLLGALANVVLSQDTKTSGIAFIDIKKAFETYRKRKDAMDQIKKKSDDFVAQLKARTNQVDDKTGKLSTLNAGSDEYAALEREIAVDKYTLDVDKKLKGRELDAEQRKKNGLIYKEICQEAETLRRERSLSAVLLFIPAETEFDQDLDLIVSTRAVLARDDQLDLTAEVVKRLNDQLPPAPVLPPAPTVDPKKPK